MSLVSLLPVTLEQQHPFIADPGTFSASRPLLPSSCPCGTGPASFLVCALPSSAELTGTLKLCRREASNEATSRDAGAQRKNHLPCQGFPLCFLFLPSGLARIFVTSPIQVEANGSTLECPCSLHHSILAAPKVAAGGGTMPAGQRARCRGLWPLTAGGPWDTHSP